MWIHAYLPCSTMRLEGTDFFWNKEHVRSWAHAHEKGLTKIFLSRMEERSTTTAHIFSMSLPMEGSCHRIRLLNAKFAPHKPLSSIHGRRWPRWAVRSKFLPSCFTTTKLDQITLGFTSSVEVAAAKAHSFQDEKEGDDRKKPYSQVSTFEWGRQHKKINKEGEELVIGCHWREEVAASWNIVRGSKWDVMGSKSESPLATKHEALFTPFLRFYLYQTKEKNRHRGTETYNLLDAKGRNLLLLLRVWSAHQLRFCPMEKEGSSKGKQWASASTQKNLIRTWLVK